MSLHVPAPIQGVPTPPPAAREAAPAAKLEACHLDFFYGARRALEDVSMPLYEHAVTAIMGPSGCGKSTLLRMFNRMHELYRDQRAEGRILLDGVNVLDRSIDLNTLRARVGMVFQQPAPFPMSIYDNVAFGVRLYEALSRTDLDARVEQCLRAAALWDEVKDGLRDSALGLSGGQQQRLCIARALAVRPEVILLDEPCSALDPHSSAQIEATIRNLKRDHTVAIVTHNLEQAARVSDFVAFMFLGRLVEFGPTDRVFNAPVDPRTRDYLRGRFG